MSTLEQVITSAMKVCLKLLLEPEPCNKFISRHQLSNIANVYESLERESPDVIIGILSAFITRQVVRGEFSKDAAKEIIQTLYKLKELDIDNFKRNVREFLSILLWLYESLEKCIIENRRFKECMDRCIGEERKGKERKRFRECVHQCLAEINLAKKLSEVSNIVEFVQILLDECKSYT